MLETIEAVIAPDSLLIGRTPRDLHLRQTYEVNLLALSRGGERTTTRLATVGSSRATSSYCKDGKGSSAAR